jgi:hypothetical protein
MALSGALVTENAKVLWERPWYNRSLPSSREGPVKPIGKMPSRRSSGEARRESEAA